MDGVERSEQLVLQIRLMLREAQARISDATYLRESAQSRTDSGYLLQLLAFELLLKAYLRLSGRTPGRGHKYRQEFEKLIPEVRDRIVTAATERMTTEADYSDVSALLETLSRNFICLRYPYELYEGLTPDQYRSRGEEWTAGGAEEIQADFVYYPNELQGLIHALEHEVQEWLAD